MRQWRLIYDNPTRGAENMALDAALLLSVSQQDSTPALRLYQWQPPCLSLGYGQHVSDVDAARLSERGWDLVRRPTGGRAILHADELTYSLVFPADHALAEGGIIESYRRISRALLAAFRHLGLQPDAQQMVSTTAGGAVCFNTASHYEITANGKKLVGSAQARKHGGVLQHGSLPLYGDVTRICDVLRYDSDAAREEAKVQLRSKATTLQQALGGRLIDWQLAAQAIVAGFEETFEISFVETALTGAEREHAQQLVTDIYSSATWTSRR